MEDKPHIVTVGDDCPRCFAETLSNYSSILEDRFRLSLLRATDLPPSPFRIDTPDLVILNYPHESMVMEYLSRVREQWPRVPVLGLFCSESMPRAQLSEMLNVEVDDFACCPYRAIDLIPRVTRLLDRRFLEVQELGDTQEAVRDQVAGGLIGKNEFLLREIKKIPLFGASDATLLITGETGTGKELVARAVHSNSHRKAKPFVAVNCGAIPDQLFESEMFGHVRGAYTSAFSEGVGLVAEAQGGTLFLDEVDNLTPLGQMKLLRFLQCREYRPVGSARNYVADVRILAATNANLSRRIGQGQFREDLYFRLNILGLNIPSLRNRRDDIPLLVEHFVNRYKDERKQKIMGVSGMAIGKLCSYDWPGNVRELESVIQRAVTLSRSGYIQAHDVDLPEQQNDWHTLSMREAKLKVVEQFEVEYLQAVMFVHRGNISHAAQAAGKERRTFQRLIRRYGLQRQKFGGISGPNDTSSAASGD